MLKSKTYHIYKQKSLKATNRYVLITKLKVSCVGGESMNEEKELVFLDFGEIPALNRGAIGRKWTELFDRIPKGKVLPMTKEGYGSAPNVRAQVMKYNKAKNAKVLKAYGRTDKETKKTTVYVQRVV